MTNNTIEYATPGVGRRVGWYRWVICGLLFFALTINYIDRQVIGVLKPILEKEFHWTQIDYGNIVVAFQLAYAIGMVFMGWLIDRIGVRQGFMWAVIIWSLAAIGHGFAHWMPQEGTINLWIITVSWATLFFMAMRFVLGISEAGAFPGAVHAVAEWFPKKERSLATGIFNAGTNVGAIATPLLVPIIVAAWGWPEAFWITGAVGLIWAIFWWVMYRAPEVHPRVSPTELAYIRSDPADPPVKVRWLRLFPHKQTWAFATLKFLTDPIWWLYLFWVPDFLNKQHGLNLKDFGPPLVVIYLLADVGSVGGGWLSSSLIKRGWSVNAARKTAMLICALCVVPIGFASQASSLWVATLLIGLAAAAHQGWSCNVFTTVSDMMPRKAVSSVVGIGGMAGAIGGMLIAKIVSYILDQTNNNYFYPFLIASVAYLFALAVFHLLVPRMEPAKLSEVEELGGTKICENPSCRTANSLDARFCRRCGQELPEANRPER